MDFLTTIIYMIIFLVTGILAVTVITIVYMGIFYLLLKISFIRRFAQKIIDRIEERENR